MWIAFLPSGLSQVLARKGDCSYGIYILHFPILQTIFMSFPGISAPALFCAGLFITIPVATLSWKWIEKPGMSLRPRLEELVRSNQLFKVLAARLTATRSVRF